MIGKTAIAYFLKIQNNCKMFYVLPNFIRYSTSHFIHMYPLVYFNESTKISELHISLRKTQDMGIHLWHKISTYTTKSTGRAKRNSTVIAVLWKLQRGIQHGAKQNKINKYHLTASLSCQNTFVWMS